MCSMIFADQAASLKKFYYKLFFGTPCSKNVQFSKKKANEQGTKIKNGQFGTEQFDTLTILDQGSKNVQFSKKKKAKEQGTNKKNGQFGTNIVKRIIWQKVNKNKFFWEGPRD